MSLVLGRKEGQNLFLLGDTKLTDGKTLPNEIRPERSQMVSDPRDSAVKVTIIHPEIAIAFAGGATYADDAIRASRNQSLEKIVQILKESTISSENDVEYIIAVNNPVYDLITVKKGQISYAQQNCWIGDADAFNFYQESIFEQKLCDTGKVHENLYYCQQAMKAVIESSKFPTINGFAVTVTNQAGFFTYQQHVTVEILPMTLFGLGPTTTVIGHGSAQSGGYTVNFCPDPRMPDILPVHILQGEIGIIYQSKNGGLLYPEVIPQIDDTEFSEVLQQRFAITVQYRLSPPIKSYFNRGVKALRKGDTSSAIRLFEKGLNESDLDLKPLLNINMASALYFSGDPIRAAQYAHEAIRLDPTNYQKWLKIISSGRQGSRQQA